MALSVFIIYLLFIALYREKLAKRGKPSAFIWQFSQDAKLYR